MDINGKRAIVTGSAGGIGRATAAMLAARGAAEIALVDVNEAGLAETARLVEAQGAKASFHPLDLSDIAATEAWFSAHGDVDILHNNAGVRWSPSSMFIAMSWCGSPTSSSMIETLWPFGVGVK